jgi:hypothetical protein
MFFKETAFHEFVTFLGKSRDPKHSTAVVDVLLYGRFVTEYRLYQDKSEVKLKWLAWIVATEEGF